MEESSSERAGSVAEEMEVLLSPLMELGEPSALLSRLSPGSSNIRVDLGEKGGEQKVFSELAAGSRESVQVFDDSLSLEYELIDTTDYISDVAYSDGGGYLAGSSNEGVVFVYETESYNLEQTLTQSAGAVTAVTFSNGLVAYSGDEIYIHDTDTWGLVQSIGGFGIEDIDLSPDGELLCTNYGVPDFGPIIYRTSDWAEVQNLERPTDARVVEFSRDSSLLAAGDDAASGNVSIYNVSDWSLRETLTAPGGNIWSATFSKDGSLFACGSEDNSVYIFDTSDWTNVETFSSSGLTPVGMSFSPNDDLFAHSSGDNNIYIYDTDDWSLSETLTPPGDTKAQVDFR